MRPGQGWSARIEACDDPKKPCMSSSGCETRPVPTRSRVSPPGPELSLGAFPAPCDGCMGASMRRHAPPRERVGRGPCSHETHDFPGAQGLGTPEGRGGPSAIGRGGSRTRRGLRPRHARRGRARNPGGPCSSSRADRSHGDPVTALRRAARPRAHALPARTGHRRSARGEVGRRQGTSEAEADGSKGIGGLHPNPQEEGQDAADRDLGVRGQAGPGRCARGAGGDLRAGLPGLTAWLPARVASGAGAEPMTPFEPSTEPCTGAR